jgi:site-specific DNA-methyltransferase (cytosine-N4-specific)
VPRSQASSKAPSDLLAGIDLGCADAGTPHPVHALHSYPAKFPPALPRLLIERLSRRGDLVLDPFAGCGTTLVEALLLGRRAIGSDLNPVAVVASRAKTRVLTATQLLRLKSFAVELPSATGPLLAEPSSLPMPAEWRASPGRRFRGLQFWFSERVARELVAIRQIARSEADPNLRAVLDLCLSAIVVSVSWQDSDTRYVRRAKDIADGDAIRAYQRKLADAITALGDFSKMATQSAEVVPSDARDLTYLRRRTVDLMVTSPPYPNAWSYHLYHQNRILWLDDNPWDFKAKEIGSHRAYSAKNGADAADFEADMTACLERVAISLKPGGYAVVVVGDSLVRGEVVPNDAVIRQAARTSGLRPIAVADRIIAPSRKAFNPAIGKIKSEHVLVFER